MARPFKPFIVRRRSDTKTYHLTLNTTCGLPPRICKSWNRISFQDLPDELAHYRYPKTNSAAEAGALALITFLKQTQKPSYPEKVNLSEIITIKDFAQDMFLENSPHLTRWTEKGYILKPSTVQQYRRFLVNYILPEFGSLKFNNVYPANVEDFLLGKKLSNSCRNGIIHTLKLVMREAKREGIIKLLPEIEPFKRMSKRQDVLSSQELIELFPFDEKELINVWKRPSDMRKERDVRALMFGTLFCVAVSAGLRSCEVRALHTAQVSIPYSGLIIDRALDEKGQIGPLKMATSIDTRARVVLIPEITLNMLQRWLYRVHKCPGWPGLIFPYRGKPVTGYYILDRFKFGLSRLGIDYKTRRLTVHCLRYTYNTKMKTLLSAQVLKEFMGHKSDAMTEHYDNPILLERLEAFQKDRPAVEKFW